MWEQLWGSMTWGAIAVPTMGLIGMTLLIGGLLGAAAVLYRKNLTKGAMSCAVLAIAIGPLAGIAGRRLRISPDLRRRGHLPDRWPRCHRL